MREIILEVKAEAENELARLREEMLMAQAKVEVANAILAKCDAYEADSVSEVDEVEIDDETVESESVDDLLVI